MICNIFSILPFLVFDVLSHKRFLFWQCPIYAQYERERLKSVHFLMYYRSKNVYQGIRSVSCLDPLMVSHPLSMVKVQILNVVVDRGVWFQPAFSLTTPFVMFSSPRLLPETSLSSSSCDALTTPPLSTCQVPLILRDPPWNSSHSHRQASSLPSCVIHSSPLSATRNQTSTWAHTLKAPPHKAECEGEIHKEDRPDSLAHSLLSDAYWMFAQWTITQVNWKEPEVTGFLWLLFTALSLWENNRKYRGSSSLPFWHPSPTLTKKMFRL